MWIAKGRLLAAWLFGFGTMAWLYFALYRHLPPNSAVSISIFPGLTTANPFWWAALLVCFVLGLAIARSWSGPLGLWITLLVTGLIPAGSLTLFLLLVYKLKHISQGHL
jgi:hypothetical protein